MRGLVSCAAIGAMCGVASADILITEWMYDGVDREWVELTNTGNAPVDLTGWSYDDDSQTPGSTSLSAFGIVLPGECVILAENTEAAFRTAWGLDPSVKVIGGNTNNLGRNDEINIYDSTGTLADRLDFGDEEFPGTIRTQRISGNPATPAALGVDDASQWVLSFVGDTYGSYASTGGDVGNPGICIPAPASLGALGVGLLAGVRRSRRVA